MILEVALWPSKTFDRLRDTDILALAIVLLGIRWAVAPITTVLGMYLRNSPMLFTPLFGLDEATYRFYEIFWYGPYGALMILIIAAALFIGAKGYYHEAGVTFRKTFQIVSLAFFTPWVPSILGDAFLLAAVNSRPEFLVPFHMSVLTWECVLVAIGFRRVFNVAPSHCVFLALAAAGLFLGLGAVVIR